MEEILDIVSLDFEILAILADFLQDVASITTDVFEFIRLVLFLRVWRVASSEIPSFRRFFRFSGKEKELWRGFAFSRGGGATEKPLF